MLCTALVNDDGVRISTVERLNAAFAGMGIDNVVVEVDAPDSDHGRQCQPFCFSTATSRY